MTTESAEPAAQQVFDGPDPRMWLAQPGFIEAVKNVEAIDALLVLLKGPIAQESTAAYREALTVLARMGYQARHELSVLILQAQGIPVPDEEDKPSAFSTAGKPRAFGAEKKPDME